MPPPTQDTAEASGDPVWLHVQWVPAFRSAGDQTCRIPMFVGELVEKGMITNASLDTKDVRKLKDEGRCPVNIGFTSTASRSWNWGCLTGGYSRRRQKHSSGARVHAPRSDLPTAAPASVGWNKRFGRIMPMCLFPRTQIRRRNSISSPKSGDERGAGGLQLGDPFEGSQLTQDHGRQNRAFRISRRNLQSRHKGVPAGQKQNARAGRVPARLLERRKIQSLAANQSVAKPNPRLLPLNPAPELTEFFRNGSSGVPKARAGRPGLQRVGRRMGHTIWGSTGLEKWTEYVRAKLAGRWWNGEIVQPGQSDPPARCGGYPRTSKLNDFDFSEDPRAHGCPFGRTSGG